MHSLSSSPRLLCNVPVEKAWAMMPGKDMTSVYDEPPEGVLERERRNADAEGSQAGPEEGA